MKEFVVWVIVLPSGYCHNAGFNLLMIWLSENQLKKMFKFKLFNERCNRTGLLMCTDKCSNFGIKKNVNSSTRLHILRKHFRIK